jgi:hypothetical protein
VGSEDSTGELKVKMVFNSWPLLKRLLKRKPQKSSRLQWEC